MATFLIALLIAPALAIDSERPDVHALAEVHALTAAVREILSSASAKVAHTSGVPSLTSLVDAIVDCSNVGQDSPANLSTYDAVLAAFEDGSHPMLADEPDDHESVGNEQLQQALRREKLRREQAELALEAAMQRAKKAERRLSQVARAKRKAVHS